MNNYYTAGGEEMLVQDPYGVCVGRQLGIRTI